MCWWYMGLRDVMSCRQFMSRWHSRKCGYVKKGRRVRQRSGVAWRGGLPCDKHARWGDDMSLQGDTSCNDSMPYTENISRRDDVQRQDDTWYEMVACLGRRTCHDRQIGGDRVLAPCMKAFHVIHRSSHLRVKPPATFLTQATCPFLTGISYSDLEAPSHVQDTIRPY